MGPDDPPASNLNSADCFQNPYVTFVLTNTGLWGQMKGLATWTSYFEAHSFSLAFVQFGLFHIKRVSEQRLSFGFKLYRPVPHGEQIQRLALCILAFPTLPKQAQVTTASREAEEANTHTC